MISEWRVAEVRGRRRRGPRRGRRAARPSEGQRPVHRPPCPTTSSRSPPRGGGRRRPPRSRPVPPGRSRHDRASVPTRRGCADRASLAGRMWPGCDPDGVRTRSASTPRTPIIAPPDSPRRDRSPRSRAIDRPSDHDEARLGPIEPERPAPARRLDGEDRAIAPPFEIRHGSNSKTPPIRIATDRRGRNREEAGYKRGRCLGRRGGFTEAPHPTITTISADTRMSRGCPDFFPRSGKAADNARYHQ